MKTLSVLALILAVALSACGPQHSRLAGKPITTNWLVTQFGEHHSEDGAWRVSVSATDRTVDLTSGRYLDRVPTTNTDGTVSFCTGTVTNTHRKGGWRAQAGWFVFVENDTRAWCYDGAEFLYLLQKEPNAWASYGAPGFPCPVPGQVLARLTDSARNAIGKESP